MKLVFGAITLVGFTSLAGWAYWQAETEEVTTFRTLPVERGDLLLAVNATGRIEPVEVIDVGAQVLGRIRSFGPDPQKPGKTVDYGSRVTKGTLLAQIDDAIYQGALRQAEANEKLANSEMTQYQAQLNQAERDWRRAERLKNTISQSEIDEALAAWEMAKAAVVIGGAKIESAEVAVDIAQTNLGYTTSFAPIDGIVIDRLVDVGQTVVTGLNAPSLFLLARDLSSMQIWAAVSEADIGQIRVGQKVTFSVDAYSDETMNGIVSQIRLNATTSHNVVTYGVIVDIDNADGRLLPYMTAMLQFELNRREDAILVPNQALRWRPKLENITPSMRGDFSGYPGKEVDVEKPTVWVKAADGLVRPVVVEIGLSDLVVSEMTAGELDPGTDVVIGTEHREVKSIVTAFMPKKDDDPKNPK